MADVGSLLAAVPSLPVSDVAATVAFFGSTLELAPRHQDAGIAVLARDAVELHLWLADGSAAGAETYLAGSASCRIEVIGVDDLYEHCSALGVVHPNALLQDQGWGTREFGILDPDGNLIGLYERTPA